MTQLRVLFAVLVVLVFCGLARAQSGSPTAYVSTYIGHQILSINTSTGMPTTLLSTSGGRYEGMVFGPDKRLYACDPENDQIIRLDPNALNPAATVEVVFQGVGSSPLRHPQCGRFTHLGDFYVNSQDSGSGVWKFAGLASVPSGGPYPAPVRNTAVVLTSTQGGEDLSQANNGDLLIVVDDPDKRVVLSSFVSGNPFTTASVLIQNPALPATPVLGDATGIVRSSTGDIFVSNGAPLSNLNHFTSNGTLVGTCASFAPDEPFHIAIAADDTIYVATSNAGFHTGKLWSVDTSCNKTLVASLALPAVGVALPATSRSKTKTFTTSQVFNYGSSAYQVKSGSCTATITETQTAPSDLNPLLGSLSNPPPNFNGATLLPNLGEGGFEDSYVVTQTSCQPQPDGTFGYLIAALVDNPTNPRIIRCDSGTCALVSLTGVYPLATIIPGDGGVGGKGPGFSKFFLANLNLAAIPPGGSAANFCGFQSPLTNTTDPNAAASFDTDDDISVKFKLTTGANCTGSNISTAQALLSVSQIADANGVPTFAVQTIKSHDQVIDPPLFKFSNGRYVFSLDLDGYALGTYQLTVTFLTNDAPIQSTLFKVVPDQGEE